MITLCKKLADKLEFNFKAEYYISLIKSDWFYIIPTLKINRSKHYLEFEIDWLLSYFYVSFSKIEDD